MLENKLVDKVIKRSKKKTKNNKKQKNKQKTKKQNDNSVFTMHSVVKSFAFNFSVCF